MPKTQTRLGVDLPETLQRSSDKAQRTYAKTLASAEEQYGSGERASRTAYAALKHSFEKVDGRWKKKDEPGPSDPRAKQSGKAARDGRGESFGGVDYYGHTKDELYQRARKLGIEGRSSMNKKELARAIAESQR